MVSVLTGSPSGPTIVSWMLTIYAHFLSRSSTVTVMFGQLTLSCWEAEDILISDLGKPSDTVRITIDSILQTPVYSRLTEQRRKNTPWRGVEPRSRAAVEMTGACTNPIYYQGLI